MKRLNKIPILLLSLFVSCAGVQTTNTVGETPETASTENLETEEQNKEEKDDSSQAKQAEKSAAHTEEKTNYDGLTYIGPATEDFNDGLRKYISEGCESAIKSWIAAFEKDSENPQIAFNIGVCYEHLKNIKESSTWFETAYLADTDFIKPLYNMALLFIPDKIKEKESYFVQLIEKSGDVVEKYNFLAWLYLKLNKWDEAEKYAKMALKEDEQNSDAVVSLATSYFNKKMYELAESALETAEKWDPNNFRLQRLYGFIMYKMGYTKEATDHLMKALQFNVELPEVRNLLAVLAMKIEDYATAKEYLEFALKIKDDFWPAKLNLAMAYKGLGEFKKSEQLLNELEAVGNLPVFLKKGVLFNKALLYLDADVDGDKNPERFDIAVKYFTNYLNLIAKSETYKSEKTLIEGYIKEAHTEKKKLEFAIAAKIKAEKRRQAQEEEARLFQQNKEAAFKKAEAANSIEEWQNFLKEYPVIDDNDFLSLAAQAQLVILLQLKEPEKGGSENNNGK